MPDRTCSIDGCSRPAGSRGWCQMHYARWWRHGDPTTTLLVMGRGTEAQRLWGSIDTSDPDACWPWPGATRGAGYGTIRAFGRNNVLTHRLAYELAVGPIPEGLVIDHLCRNTRCVNPSHLEPVTPRENTLRGRGIAASNAQKTHCPAGHPYDEENTYLIKTGGRMCRTCMRLRMRARRAAGRA